MELDAEHVADVRSGQRTEIRGELKLLLQMFHTGITGARLGRRADLAWVMQSERAPEEVFGREGPVALFTFDTVCHYLGIDPDFCRSNLDNAASTTALRIMAHRR